MKKSIPILLGLLLLFCLSASSTAQSSQKNLSQLELAQQFIGTWESDIGEDSLIHFICAPSGKGFFWRMDWKANGETFSTASSVLGLDPDHKTLILSSIWQQGNTAQDIGRFVSETKLVWERFLPGQPNHATALSEVDFSQPNTFTWLMYGRDSDITWEPPWKFKWTFTRVDE